MTGDAVKIGLIGLGNMGCNHLRVLSILKSADLRFVYDSDFTKAQQLAAEKGTRAVEKLEDGLSDDLDAIVICTPTSTHHGYIKQAAAYVKNIFVEKPMAATLEEAQATAALAKDKDLNLQVGFIERFNPAVQQLKRVLDSSSVINVDFTRTNKLSSRITDVDVITDLMVHDIDLALYLNGPAKDVAAHGSVDNNLVSFASAVITHENGKFSRIQSSRITEKKMRKIEATCEDIFVDCELLRKEITVSKQSQIVHKPGEAYKVSAVQENIEVQPQEALLLELQSFLDSAVGNRHDMNPGADDGLAALQICADIQNRIYGS